MNERSVHTPPGTGGQPPQVQARWENGSEYHWFSYPPAPRPHMPWGERAGFHGCARDSLRALIAFARQTRGWRRLWVPSYFCQRVVSSLLETGIPLRVYEDGPWGGSLRPLEQEARAGDAVLRVRYFGLTGVEDPGWLRDGPMEVVEDHSHDPWAKAAFESRADWCVVSLRKTLPVPDGGVLWSPAGHELPPQPGVTPEHRDLSLGRLSGMMLKGLYLQGHDVGKATFRRLMVAGEEQLAQGPVSGLPDWTASLLATFPVEAWRRRRARNHRALRQALAGLDWVRVLPSDGYPDVCPFSGVLEFDTPERRESVKRRLIASDVYPAVLWPLEEMVVPGIPEADRAFSERMLSVHCDMRYGEADMELVASLIGQGSNDGGHLETRDGAIPSGVGCQG